ncbi:MAG: tetratricopeptide repeat protein [Thermoguttaceae bacterium]|jgi:Flp pilus assembly protein TadD
MARPFRSLVVALAVAALWAVLAHSRALFGQAVSPGASVPPKAATAPETIPEVEEARKALGTNWDRAAYLLRQAVRENKDLPPADVIIGQWCAQSNQGSLARMSLEKAVMSDPKDPEAFVILGNMALQEQRTTEAELLFLKAQQLLGPFDRSPKRKGILEQQTISGLAGVDEAREKWKDAQTKLETLLKLSPKDALAMQRLARALFQQRKAADSLKWLRKSKEVGGPDILTPEAALAQLYERFPDHGNAIVWMQKALEKAPADLATRLVTAQWTLETGQLDEAEKHAVKALQLAEAERQHASQEEAPKLEARLLNAKILRGLVALYRKDFKTAEKFFEDAHLQSPGNFAASNNLALALCEQKDEGTGKPDQAKLNRALEFANANFQADPRNPEAASTLGWVLYRVGCLDRAENALRQALAASLGPDAAYHLARASYDRGDKELAKNLLEAALKTPSFLTRPEAQALYDKIRAEPPAKDKEESNPFSIRPEAKGLLEKIEAGPPAKDKEKPKDAR